MGALEKFSLAGKIAVITGGGGILGAKHAEAMAEAGGVSVLWDIRLQAAERVAGDIRSRFDTGSLAQKVDITNIESIKNGFGDILATYGRIDVLINNAASDSKVETGQTHLTRFEHYPLETWRREIDIGLTGAFLCSQVIGPHMAERRSGSIINMASDLAVISPDQRLYRQECIAEDMQPVKAVTYSIIKHGILGLTKYLATYWAHRNVRVNSLSPGGVYNKNLPDDFVKRLTHLIPMGRMATTDEYKAAVIFLSSEASTYMTGHNLIIDGGRTVW